MQCLVVDVEGNVLRVENREPECGIDECRVCGKCLACCEASLMPCNNGAQHVFTYEEKNRKKRSAKPASRAHV